MMKGIQLALTIATTALVLSLQPVETSADTLLIEAVEKNVSVQRPVRGQSMGLVESRYGKASRVISAVGEPPITRWRYADFTVYFEHSHVIHSVMNKR